MSPSSRSSVSVYDSAPHLHFFILFVFILFNWREGLRVCSCRLFFRNCWSKIFFMVYLAEATALFSLKEKIHRGATVIAGASSIASHCLRNQTSHPNDILWRKQQCNKSKGLCLQIRKGLPIVICFMFGIEARWPLWSGRVKTALTERIVENTLLIAVDHLRLNLSMMLAGQQGKVRWVNVPVFLIMRWSLFLVLVGQRVFWFFVVTQHLIDQLKRSTWSPGLFSWVWIGRWY